MSNNVATVEGSDRDNIALVTLNGGECYTGEVWSDGRPIYLRSYTIQIINRDAFDAGHWSDTIPHNMQIKTVVGVTAFYTSTQVAANGTIEKLTGSDHYTNSTLPFRGYVITVTSTSISVKFDGADNVYGPRVTSGDSIVVWIRYTRGA